MADEKLDSVEGPGKGKAFFDRARTVAQSENYDYAIDLFLDGLLREPQNIPGHEALRDVALRRKLKGGKPAGGFFGPKGHFKGKTPKEIMLNIEGILTKDPGNITEMVKFVRAAQVAGYLDVIAWFGPVLIQANRTSPKPKKEIYLEMADIYEAARLYKEAIEAVNWAQQMDPLDGGLISRIKDLSASQTLMLGKYENAQSFKDSIRDHKQTKELMEEDNLARSEEHRTKLMERSKADYEANPMEMQVINKYVRSLIDMETEEHENLAIDILRDSYARTQTYRYKMTIGEIRIRQFKRTVRILSEALKATPNDKTLTEQLHQAQRERLAFELVEYKERSNNYPTDANVQYEYGVRLYQAHKYDEAIAAFQMARNGAQHRSDAQHLLGRCFTEQGLKPEALDSFKQAIEAYELAETGDSKSKELHYWLARCYEDLGQNEDATQVYSKITQWDIHFRDARNRLAALRTKKSVAS
jgi:tetratricopeptide (TPR) repeat protein